MLFKERGVVVGLGGDIIGGKFVVEEDFIGSVVGLGFSFNDSKLLVVDVDVCCCFGVVFFCNGVIVCFCFCCCFWFCRIFWFNKLRVLGVLVFFFIFRFLVVGRFFWVVKLVVGMVRLVVFIFIGFGFGVIDIILGFMVWKGIWGICFIFMYIGFIIFVICCWFIGLIIFIVEGILVGSMLKFWVGIV